MQLQPLSQSDKLKTKMKLLYLFLYYGEIQKETVARKRCNLTLNLCTEGIVQKKEQKKAHKDKIQGIGPDLSGTFSQ